MAGRVGLEIYERQREEPLRRSEPIFLEMDEAACHLDQALVKFRLRLTADRQPDFLQHIMRFVSKAAR